MKLLLLRHMKTQYNRQGILQGKKDIPILAPREDQADAILLNKRILNDEKPFDHVLVSTLQRTRMTATLYVDSFAIEPLLDELDFGEYEGRKKSDLIREQPLWTSCPDLLTLGEPLGELENRVKKFVETYSAVTCPGSKILIFGHGAWIRALLSFVKTGSIREMNRMSVENNQIIQLMTTTGK
ncbi:MAG: histidine phosphatase family protein [Proteobacteria bacterium]|nr:histidine phosphatase family protein [Desulfobacula sp.]MBU3952375.1 histidine phosphatase family protein [Pseudomonadota bacterium]MBU4131314.1 histidine phosphatase family protein [Pseudomonadota bacterium]